MHRTDAVTMDLGQGTIFNEKSPRYMCCCNCIHVKTGTLIIAVLTVILLPLNIIMTAGGILGSHDSTLPITVGSLVGVVMGCASHAFRARRAAFLLPLIIVQVIEICVSIGVIILCIFALGGAEIPLPFLRLLIKNYTITIDIKIVSAVIIVSYAINIALALWFFWVVYKCFMFFRDQANFAVNNTANVGYRINSNPNSYKRHT